MSRSRSMTCVSLLGHSHSSEQQPSFDDSERDIRDLCSVPESEAECLLQPSQGHFSMEDNRTSMYSIMYSDRGLSVTESGTRLHCCETESFVQDSKAKEESFAQNNKRENFIRGECFEQDEDNEAESLAVPPVQHGPALISSPISDNETTADSDFLVNGAATSAPTPSPRHCCSTNVAPPTPAHFLQPHTSLHWRKCSDMPQELNRPQSILIGDMVYVASCFTNDVLLCDTRTDNWSVLPPCPVRQFGLGQFSGMLITVGGVDEFDKAVGDIYTYNAETREWYKSIFHLPTPRSRCSIVNYQSYIVVCGGKGHGKLVEVFNIETLHWHRAATLPEECENMKVAVINDTCYLGCGGSATSVIYPNLCPTKVVYSASLLELCHSGDHRLRVNGRVKHKPVWTKLPQTPFKLSALGSMGGALVLLGGRYNKFAPAKEDIYAYCHSANLWLRVGTLPQANREATVQNLPSGELMFIGGWDNGDKKTKAVHIGILK